MLMQSRYAKEYLDRCRKDVKAQVAACRKLRAAQPPGAAAVERQFVDNLLLALDRRFVHRGRGMEGKDGNPLNEVRMLCDAILEHDGCLTGSKSIKYEPESSVLKLAIGDDVRLSADDFSKIAGAFLDEIETRYS